MTEFDVKIGNPLSGAGNAGWAVGAMVVVTSIGVTSSVTFLFVFMMIDSCRFSSGPDRPDLSES